MHLSRNFSYSPKLLEVIILSPTLNEKAYSSFVTKSSCYKPSNVMRSIDGNRIGFLWVIFRIYWNFAETVNK